MVLLWPPLLLLVGFMALPLCAEECPTTTRGVNPVILSVCASIRSKLSVELKTKKSAEVVASFTFPRAQGSTTGVVSVSSSRGTNSFDPTTPPVGSTLGASFGTPQTTTVESKSAKVTTSSKQVAAAASKSASHARESAAAATAQASNAESHEHYIDTVVVPAVVCSVVGAIFIALLLWFCLRRRRKHRERKDAAGYEKGNGYVSSGDSPPVLPPVKTEPAMSTEYSRFASHYRTPPYQISPKAPGHQKTMSAGSQGVGGAQYSKPSEPAAAGSGVGVGAGAAVAAAAAVLPSGTHEQPYQAPRDQVTYGGPPYGTSAPQNTSHYDGPLSGEAYGAQSGQPSSRANGIPTGTVPLQDYGTAAGPPPGTSTTALPSSTTSHGLSTGQSLGAAAAAAAMAGGAAYAVHKSDSGPSTPRAGSPTAFPASSPRVGATSPTGSELSGNSPWETQPLRHFRRAHGDEGRRSIDESSVSTVRGPTHVQQGSDPSFPNNAPGHSNGADATYSSGGAYLAPAAIAAVAAPAAAADTPRNTEGTHSAPTQEPDHDYADLATHEPHALTPLTELYEPETDTETSQYFTDTGGVVDTEDEDDRATNDGLDVPHPGGTGVIMPGAWQPSEQSLSADEGSRPISTSWLSSGSEAGQADDPDRDSRYSGFSGASIPAPLTEDSVRRLGNTANIVQGRYVGPGATGAYVPPGYEHTGPGYAHREDRFADRPAAGGKIDTEEWNGEGYQADRGQGSVAQMAQRLNISRKPVSGGSGIGAME